MAINSRGDLIDATNVLIRRRRSTVDPSEKKTIEKALEKLNALIDKTDHAALLDAARAVASAADELETVIASARKGPFDNYLTEMQDIISRLQTTQATIHAADKLSTASFERDVTAPPPADIVPAVTGDATERTVNSTKFSDLRNEYEDFFARCSIRDEFKKNLAYYVTRLTRFQNVYEDVSKEVNPTMPWAFVGIIHGMECGFNFTTHLHNGDPLSKRTTHVPRGRPADGAPPFTWRESAIDALRQKKYNAVTDWSIPHMLYLWEEYNGFGYRPFGVPSPYLWSFSNLYQAGKYVSDHQYDPAAVSKQCGSAVILKELKQMGKI